MKKSSLDTNALLRLLLKDVPEQHEMIKQLIAQADRTFLVSDTAIIELVFVLERHYEFSRSLIKEAIDALVSVTNILININSIQGALEAYTAHPMLSFEDCYLAEEAARNNAVPLWTFDKKLARQSEHAQIIN